MILEFMRKGYRYILLLLLVLIGLGYLGYRFPVSYDEYNYLGVRIHVSSKKNYYTFKDPEYHISLEIEENGGKISLDYFSEQIRFILN